jgi:hypothetical protein
MTLCINDPKYSNALPCAEGHFPQCRNLFTIMVSAIMLNVLMLNVLMRNVLMLNVLMLNAIMLSVVMLVVVAPSTKARA